jgi:hypothetical protein
MGDVHVNVSDPAGKPLGSWTTTEEGEHIPDPPAGGWNPGVTEMRITALDRAINYHQNREGDPDKIVTTAAKFYAYITQGASE